MLVGRDWKEEEASRQDTLKLYLVLLVNEE